MAFPGAVVPMAIDRSSWRLPPGIQAGFHRNDARARGSAPALDKHRPPAVGDRVELQVHVTPEAGGGWGILGGVVEEVWPDGRLEVSARCLSLDAPEILDGDWEIVLRFYPEAFESGPWIIESMSAFNDENDLFE